MKKAGWILIVISAVVIFYNAVIVKQQNDTEVNDHPWKTLFSLGGNLKNYYSFKPPYSEFEVFIIGMGIAGIVLVVIGKSQQEKEQMGRESDKSKTSTTS